MSKLSVWIHEEEVAAEAVFLGIEKDALIFLDTVWSYIKANGGPLLLSAATAAVTAAATTGGTDEQKLAAATASIISTLKTQGVDAAKNAAELGVNAVLANMKQQLAPDAGSTAPAAAPAPAS